MNISHGSLFAGIGGFDLGFERAGIETVWTVEKDTSCNQVLAAHWPEVRRYDDVREVGRHNLSPVELISGGFPCQDLSVAGRRAGLAGERSGLWFEFARIVEEMAPRWVVVENVPGLLSSAGGADFAGIVGTLERFGYCVAWRVLDSQYFGVPQRRRRVFVVGSLGDGSSAQVLFESEGGTRDSAEGREERKGLASEVAVGINESGLRGRQQGSAATYVTNAFHGYTGGPDDNDAQGKHLVVAGVSENQRGEILLTDKSHQLTSGGGKPGQGYPAVVIGFDASRSGQDALENLSPTMTHKGDGPQAHSAFHKLAVAGFSAGNSSEAYGVGYEEGRVPPIRSAESGTNQAPTVAGPMGVRRLTPTECERLQGFPDGWTEGLSDTQRYRCLGNAVTVNVAEWLGRRLADQSCKLD